MLYPTEPRELIGTRVWNKYTMGIEAPCFVDVMEPLAKDAATACLFAFGYPKDSMHKPNGRNVKRRNFQGATGAFKLNKALDNDNFAVYESPGHILWAFRGTDVYDEKRLLGLPGLPVGLTRLNQVVSWSSLIKDCALQRGDMSPTSDCNADHYIATRMESRSPLHKEMKGLFDSFVANYTGSKQIVVAGSSLGGSLAAFVAHEGQKVYLFSPGGAPGPRPSWVRSKDIQSYREVYDIVSLSTIAWWPTISAVMKGSNASEPIKYHSVSAFFCADQYKALTGQDSSLADNQVVSLNVRK